MVKQIPVGKKGLFALVDDDDYEDLIKLPWYEHKSQKGKEIYAITVWLEDGKRRRELMHKKITGYSETDHINRNGLDNRRSNLRECNRSENVSNQGKREGDFTSEYKGVYWKKSNRKWVAAITKDYKRHHLGYFDNELEAAKAYDIAAYDYHGTFAKTNGAWNADY